MRGKASAYTLPGSAESKKMIWLIGAFIGCGWIIVSVADSISSRDLASELGLQPYANGFAPLQFITYSMTHGYAYLAPREGQLFSTCAHLLFLFWLVNVASRCLTPAIFIRIYSLGIVCGGLIFLLLTSQTKVSTLLTGGCPGLGAIFLALVARGPKRFLDTVADSIVEGPTPLGCLMVLPSMFVPMSFALSSVVVIGDLLSFFKLVSTPGYEPNVAGFGVTASSIAGLIYGLAERLITARHKSFEG
jgi:hypothetical protein